MLQWRKYVLEDWTCVLRNDNASGQVHGDETELAAALDELVRLRDELHVLDLAGQHRSAVVSPLFSENARHIFTLQFWIQKQPRQVCDMYMIRARDLESSLPLGAGGEVGGVGWRGARGGDHELRLKYPRVGFMQKKIDPRVRVHEQAPRHALGFLKNLWRNHHALDSELVGLRRVPVLLDYHLCIVLPNGLHRHCEGGVKSTKQADS